MKNRQILCLLVLYLVTLSNRIVTGLTCHQCQYTGDGTLENKIATFLKYSQFNASTVECESKPGEDTLHDLKEEEEEEEDYEISTTELYSTTTDSTEENSSTAGPKDVIKKREIMESLRPMVDEKAEVTEYLYCVSFKAYTKDDKKPVVIRGGFKSKDGDQDKKLVLKNFDNYPIETYWKEFFRNITNDLTDSQLYMCKSNGCNSEATSLLKRFSSLTSIFFSITCLLFSRFYSY